MAISRQLKLGLQLDIDSPIILAQHAEAARFDWLLIPQADALADAADLVGATSNIGLLVSLGISGVEPSERARQLAVLDQQADGRLGWHLLVDGPTTGLPSHERFQRARDYLQQVQGLWANAAQAQPVIFQTGASEAERHLAGRSANAVFAAVNTFEDACEYYQDAKQRAANAGRNPGQTFVLPSIMPIIADTDEAAQRIWHERHGDPDLVQALALLGRRFNDHDFSAYALDAPFPDLIESDSGGHLGHVEHINHFALRHALSVRQVVQRFATPCSAFVGSPLTVANILEYWFDARAADGFNLSFDSVEDLVAFSERILPILRERGLYRSEYSQDTLRGHLGLPAQG